MVQRRNQRTDTFIGNQKCKIDLLHMSVNEFFLESEQNSFAFMETKTKLPCLGGWLKKQEYKTYAYILLCDSPS